MKKLVPILALLACTYNGSANAHEILPVSEELTILEKAISTLDTMAYEFESNAYKATQAGDLELAGHYSERAMNIRIQELNLRKLKQSAEK
jgi:hypothetical protein